MPQILSLCPLHWWNWSRQNWACKHRSRVNFLYAKFDERRGRTGAPKLDMVKIAVFRQFFTRQWWQYTSVCWNLEWIPVERAPCAMLHKISRTLKKGRSQATGWNHAFPSLPGHCRLDNRKVTRPLRASFTNEGQFASHLNLGYF